MTTDSKDLLDQKDYIAAGKMYVATKWAVDQKVLIERNRSQDQNSSFIVTGDRLKDLKNKKNEDGSNFLAEWITYPESGEFKEAIDVFNQERYELYCYGYLFFYDNHIKKVGLSQKLQQSEEHTIHFDWNVGSANGKKVKISLAPGPRLLRDNKSHYLKFLTATLDSDPPPPPPPPPPPIG